MESLSSDLIRGNIDTIILKCLNHGDMYGLEICNHIKQASSGTYVLKQPTLYSALKRLEVKGFITSYWRDSSIGGRRHYYKLTEDGRKSFVGRKDQWFVSKEVIDTLVAEKPQTKQTKKPVIPAEDDENVVPAAAAVVAPVTPLITPYNPFAQSADDEDCLTLPFRIIENKQAAQSTLPQPEVKDDVPPLLKYAFAQGALSPAQVVQPTPPPPPVGNTFAKYLSPDDYAAIATVKTGASAKTSKFADYDIQIRPFVKHYLDSKRGEYHFIGKLRLVSAIIMALLAIVGIIIARDMIKPSSIYSTDESLFFILGFLTAGAYLIYYLARFVTNPQSKKAAPNSIADHAIRLCAFLGVVIAIFAVNILAGLTQIKDSDFLVFWVIPCILATVIYLEGIVQYFLRKTNLFAA